MLTKTEASSKTSLVLSLSSKRNVNSLQNSINIREMIIFAVRIKQNTQIPWLKWRLNESQSTWSTKCPNPLAGYQQVSLRLQPRILLAELNNFTFQQVAFLLVIRQVRVQIPQWRPALLTEVMRAVRHFLRENVRTLLQTAASLHIPFNLLQ